MPSDTSRVSPAKLLKMKASGEPITMLTAYDHYFAKVIDGAGCDMILIGDSLGPVVLGYENTVPVTVDEVIYHVKPVARAARRALVIGDMPFMSYQASKEEAIKNAGRIIKEGGAQAVKLEGGVEMADTIEFLTERGVLVMGHVGLMPQRVHQMGGYKIQGKCHDSRKKIIADARAVADSGVFAIVLEGVPEDLASEITSEVKVPTIGICAGAGCDGQVLVIYDMLNMSVQPLPKFVKVFADAGALIKKGVESYLSQVRGREYPAGKK